MSSPQYFNPQEFINRVIEACHFGQLDTPTRELIEDAISQRLIERITTTIIGSFAESELLLLEKILEDHPELDEINAIGMVAQNVPGIEKKLVKAFKDLFEEFTHDAEEIQKHMDKSALVRKATAKA